MSGFLWIVLPLPLLAGMVLPLWHLWRDRDLRMGLAAGLLLALAARHILGLSLMDWAPTGLDGSGRPWIEVQALPAVLDFSINVVAAGVVFVLARTLAERDRAERVLWDGMEAVRELAAFESGSRAPFDERLADLLALGRARFGLELGWLARIEGDTYEVMAASCDEEFGIRSGARFAPSDTLCDAALASGGPLAIENIHESPWRERAHCAELGLGSYLGVPVTVRGELVGSLAFAGRDTRRRRFRGFEKELLRLMAHWLGAELRDLRAPDSRRATRRTEHPAPPAGSEPRTPPLAAAPQWRRVEPGVPRPPIDLNAGIARLATRLRKALGPEQLDLDLDPSLPSVALHRYELDRVLSSLLLVAAQSAGSAGLEIETGRVTAPGATGTDGFVTLTIHGRGGALGDGLLAQIFGPGTELGAGGAARGHAMRLERLEQLLERAGGDLSIDAETGRGATFTVYLPQVKPRPAGAPGLSVAPA